MGLLSFMEQGESRITEGCTFLHSKCSCISHSNNQPRSHRLCSGWPFCCHRFHSPCIRLQYQTLLRKDTSTANGKLSNSHHQLRREYPNQRALLALLPALLKILYVLEVQEDSHPPAEAYESKPNHFRLLISSLRSSHE